jgi:hypothetical protein
MEVSSADVFVMYIAMQCQSSELMKALVCLNCHIIWITGFQRNISIFNEVIFFIYSHVTYKQPESSNIFPFFNIAFRLLPCSGLSLLPPREVGTSNVMFHKNSLD